MGVLIMCRVCKTKVPMDNMRYDDNGEDLICNDCYNKRHGTYVAPKSTAPEKRVVLNKPTERTRHEDDFEKKQNEDKVTFVCEKCKFKFSRKSGFPVNQCPYCSSTYIKEV